MRGFRLRLSLPQTKLLVAREKKPLVPRVTIGWKNIEYAVSAYPDSYGVNLSSNRLLV